MSTMWMGLFLIVITLQTHLTFSKIDNESTTTLTTVIKKLLMNAPIIEEKEDDYDSFDDPEPTRYHILRFNWDDVSIEYKVVLWILVASIAKVFFNQFPRLVENLPDSSLLIVVGLVIGVILHFSHVRNSWFQLDSHIFFLFLLPPIVFDAGYSMPNRAFFDNIGSILVFAVIGTIWNMAAIGLSLWAVGLMGMFSADIPLLHILIFTSIISAVDPVAVICVFEDINVNEVLYINVFGESLLNDAVAVVLYRMCLSFAEIGDTNLIPMDYVSGGTSFFVVGIGGVIVGVIFSLIVGFITKFTHRVTVLTPVFVFLIPYLAYLTAEMCGLSAIMAIVFCGIVMKQYVKENVSFMATNAIKYFTKMLATCCETVVFMFLGLSTISTEQRWDTAFIGFTILFCLLYRIIGVVVLCFILNKFRLKTFTKVEQFVMAYGGLRGAIAYGLVMAIPAVDIPTKDIFITACIAVIFVTVFLQGITLKPLVTYLNVERHLKHNKTMTEYVLERIADYTMSGIEDICEQRGHHSMRDAFESFNIKYIRPILVRKSVRNNKNKVGGGDTKLIRVHAKIAMNEAFDVINGISQEQSKDSHHHHKSVTFANASNKVDVPIYIKGNGSNKTAAYDGPYVEIIDDPAIKSRALARKRHSIKETGREIGINVEKVLEQPHRSFLYSRNPELSSMTSLNDYADMKLKESQFVSHHNGSFTSRSVDANYASAMAHIPSVETVTIADGGNSTDLNLVYRRNSVGENTHF